MAKELDKSIELWIQGSMYDFFSSLDSSRHIQLFRTG